MFHELQKKDHVVAYRDLNWEKGVVDSSSLPSPWRVRIGGLF